MFARKKTESQPNKHQGTGDAPELSGAEVFKALTNQKQRSSFNDNPGDGHNNQEKITNESSMNGMNVLNMFAQKKPPTPMPTTLLSGFDPRSLFNNSPKRVPQNSEVDSDEEE